MLETEEKHPATSRGVRGFFLGDMTFKVRHRRHVEGYQTMFGVVRYCFRSLFIFLALNYITMTSIIIINIISSVIISDNVEKNLDQWSEDLPFRRDKIM